MPPPAAARDCLHQQRDSRSPGPPARPAHRRRSPLDSRHHRGSGLRGQASRSVLAAHQLDDLGLGTDENQSGGLAGPGEGGVLGQEPVAGMDGAGARAPGRLQDGADGQVGVCRGGGPDPHGAVGLGHVRRVGVGVGVDGDGADPEPPSGAQHATRDLAPVGDQQRVEAHGAPPTSGTRRSAPAPGRETRPPAPGPGQHPARVQRIDDAVVPQPGGGVVGRSLAGVALADPRLALRLRPAVTVAPRSPPTSEQHLGGLLAAHHGDARVGPHEEQPGRVGATAHPVVARAERAADDDGELRHLRVGHRRDHLGAVLGDAARARTRARP